VVVKDANDCPDTANITLTEPTELLCTVSPLDTLICAGDSAQFCVNPTGGTPPFTFSWDGPGGFTSADSCIYAHDDGAYSVLVTDANACTTRCEGILTTEPCGEFCSFTKGGWGSKCPSPQQADMMSTQPGCIRDHYFYDVFPPATFPLGVWVGDPTGAADGWFGAYWSTPGAVRDFLPTGGPSGPLVVDLFNPAERCTAGNLADQILALRLNVAYSCAGVFTTVELLPAVACYGDYILGDSCGQGIFDGFTVYEFLAIADSAVGGLDILGHYGATYSDFTYTADCLNNLHHGCGEDEETPPPAAARIAQKFSLGNSYPNPFNPECVIDYGLPVDCHVTLSVYNIRGQRVKVLVDEYQGAGFESVTWDGRDDDGRELASGIYFYRIQAGDFAQSRKMVLIK
jgi:hypothetical protein